MKKVAVSQKVRSRNFSLAHTLDISAIIFCLCSFQKPLGQTQLCHKFKTTSYFRLLSVKDLKGPYFFCFFIWKKVFSIIIIVKGPPSNI